MAIRIDETTLVELGLADLPEEEKKKLLQTLYETLEMRVGMRLAGVMTDEQLDEFEQLIDAKNEDGAVTWLEKNYPDYPKVVAEELDKLKAEIAKDAPKIREASTGNSTSPSPTSTST